MARAFRRRWLPALILTALAVTGLLPSSPARADLQSAVSIVRHQPLVLKVTPDMAGNLWVSVLPDSRVNWSQYAAAMCQVVVPQQARIFVIKMVDINSTHRSNNPRQWRVLGGAACGR